MRAFQTEAVPKLVTDIEQHLHFGDTLQVVLLRRRNANIAKHLTTLQIHEKAEKQLNLMSQITAKCGAYSIVPSQPMSGKYGYCQMSGCVKTSSLSYMPEQGKTKVNNRTHTH